MRRHFKAFRFNYAGQERWIVAVETGPNSWHAVAHLGSEAEALKYLDMLADLLEQMLHCPICGEMFPAANGRKYCSSGCKRKADQRARQKRSAHAHRAETPEARLVAVPTEDVA